MSCPTCDSPIPELHPLKGYTKGPYNTPDLPYVERCHDSFHVVPPDPRGVYNPALVEAERNLEQEGC